MGKSKSALVNKVYFRSPNLIKNAFATCYGYIQNKKQYGKTYYSFFELLKQAEDFPPEKIAEIQFDYLKRFLIFTEQASSYYNEVFSSVGFNPHKFQDFDDIKKIPILTKEQVRQHADKISCNKHFKRTLTAKTSGTTGKPLSIPTTIDCFQKRHALRSFFYYSNGLKANPRKVKIAGQQTTDINKTKPPYWVHDQWNNALYMSSYHLSDENLTHYIKELERFKPEIIEGYPSSIYLLALATIKLNGKVRPRLVRTGSETLHDYQREIIEEAFQCKVHNFYGAAENCATAIECKEGVLHTQPLFGFFELVNDEGNPVGNNEVGNVVGTGFSNYAFPLIRYSLEDQAVCIEQKTCKCGQSGCLIKEIVGRSDDYVTTPEGKQIGRLSQIFKDIKGLVNGQIIQKNKNGIVIRTIREHVYNDESTKQLIKQARERLGNSIQITVEEVKELEKEKNGKTRLVVSKLDKA